MTDDPRGVPHSASGTEPWTGSSRAPARPSTWPAVVGILGCVLGGFGVLGSLWGIAAYALADTIAASLPPDAGAAFQALSEYKGIGMLAAAAGLCLSVVLVIGSIALFRRRASALPLLTGWAIFQVILSLPTAYLQYLINRRQFEIIPQQQQPMFEQFGNVISFVTISVSLVWAWALPVFLFIWFSRQSVRDEIASWSPEESGMVGE